MSHFVEEEEEEEEEEEDEEEDKNREKALPCPPKHLIYLLKLAHMAGAFLLQHIISERFALARCTSTCIYFYLK